MYLRASTQNPLGWRPGTQLNGYPTAIHAGPDWKDVMAKHHAVLRAHQQGRDAQQRAQSRRAAMVDAYARGDRTRVIYRSLSGLGLSQINTGAEMVFGSPYVFHFKFDGSGFNPDPVTLTQLLLGDSNFLGAVAALEPGGLRVSFTYNGRPNNSVGNMGLEMQGVLNPTLGFLAKRSYFFFAEGGPSVTASDGTQTPSQTTTPGDLTTPDENSGSGSGPDLPSLLSGIGIGGGIALALGAFLLIRGL